MKLTKIEISGYKSYGLLCADGIELGNVNVIIGANGAGKSNFISFLDMVAYIASDRFDNFVAKNGFADSLMHFGESGTEKIRGGLEFTVDDKEDRYSFTLSASVGSKLYFERESVSYQRTGLNEPYFREFGVSTERSNLIGCASEDSTVHSILRLLRSCRIFHFNDTSINSSMRSRSYIHDNGYLRADAGNIAAYLYRMENEAPVYYERIVKIIREVFPRFDNFVLRPTTLNDADSYVLLNWREQRSDEVFGPHMLSDGTLRFIALATLLLQQEATLPSVIILDEPEMGLHPFAINILSDLIYHVSEKTQIIIATQSSELLNHFSPENVLVAEYNIRERSSYMRRLDGDKLDEWLADYTLGDLWDKNILGGVP